MTSLEELASTAGLVLSTWHLGAAELTCSFEDGGDELLLVIGPAGSSARFFKCGDDLQVNYRLTHECSTRFSERAERVLQGVTEVISAPDPELRRSLEPAVDLRAIERIDLPWLLEKGLKPAAILYASNERRLENIRARLKHSVVGNVSLGEDAKGKVVSGEGRFIYAAQSLADAERLRDLDEKQNTRVLVGEELAATYREIGLTLGFPQCCVDAFCALPVRPKDMDELYAEVQLRDWSGKPGHPLTNFVLALACNMPFFNHVPCRLDCEATMRANAKALRACYDKAERHVLTRLLSTSAVLWPSGQFCLFRAGPCDSGVISAEAIGYLAYPSLLTHGRRSQHTTSICKRASDYDIDALRARSGRLQCRVGERWHKAIRPDGVARRADRPLLAVFK